MTIQRRQQSGDDRAAARLSHRHKFDWVRDIAADTTLRDSTKLLAALAAIDKLGANGHFRATRKELGRLCGMHPNTVSRAIAQLERANYWDVEPGRGDTNTYTPILRDDRREMWFDAQSDHRKLCGEWLNAEKQFIWKCTREWLDAEKRFIGEWLDAEKRFIGEWLFAERDARDKYQGPIFNAVLDRGGSHEVAWRVAEVAWEAHQQDGMTLEAALNQVEKLPDDLIGATQAGGAPTGAPSPQLVRPLTTAGETPHKGWLDPSQGLVRPLTSTNSLTSGNDHSHKYLKSLKDFKDSKTPAPRAPGARFADAKTNQNHPHANPCLLCRGTGVFLNPDRLPVVLLDEDCRELHVDCQHSMAANLAEIRRIQSNGVFEIARTGWPEIDKHYPEFDDDYPDEDDDYPEGTFQ
jgi:DNA-binding MarR family transcriptional regulator